MTIQAKNFSTRQELETAIRTAPEQVSYIVGTKEELAHFHLSEHTFLHGVSCKVTDVVVEQSKILQKPERGRGFDYGLNGNLTSAK